MSEPGLLAQGCWVRELARKLSLPVHLETSSSRPASLSECKRDGEDMGDNDGNGADRCSDRTLLSNVLTSKR